MTVARDPRSYNFTISFLLVHARRQRLSYEFGEKRVLFKWDTGEFLAINKSPDQMPIRPSYELCNRMVIPRLFIRQIDVRARLVAVCVVDSPGVLLLLMRNTRDNKVTCSRDESQRLHLFGGISGGRPWNGTRITIAANRNVALDARQSAFCISNLCAANNATLKCCLFFLFIFVVCLALKMKLNAINFNKIS